MKCPKCNDTCRLKMTGAVCLNTKCNWFTHDRISSRFQEDMINAMYDEL